MAEEAKPTSPQNSDVTRRTWLAAERTWLAWWRTGTLSEALSASYPWRSRSVPLLRKGPG